MHEFYKIKNNYAPPIKRSSLKFRENTSNLENFHETLKEKK